MDEFLSDTTIATYIDAKTCMRQNNDDRNQLEEGTLRLRIGKEFKRIFS